MAALSVDVRVTLLNCGSGLGCYLLEDGGLQWFCLSQILTLKRCEFIIGVPAGNGLKSDAGSRFCDKVEDNAGFKTIRQK